MRLLIIALWIAICSRSFTRGLNQELEAYLDGTEYRFGDQNQYFFRADPDDVLGAGGFGVVFHGLDLLNGREVAIKVEAEALGYPLLPAESESYDRIGENRGIPHKYYNGTMNHSKFGKLNLMVIQLLGKSLAQLQIENRGKFTPKTVYEIGIQLMYRIEMIHRKGLVHRDIKPGNMGIGKSKQLIYIFDFGLAERIKDDENRHISEGPKGEYGSGTPRYMSAYAQSHIVQSRRDDLEAIGFMLMSFLRGNLPWDDDTYGKPAPINPMVRKKKNLHFKTFCRGYAKQMVEYFEYVRNELEFSTRPNYPYLRKLFRAALSDLGKKEDYIFDWTTK